MRRVTRSAGHAAPPAAGLHAATPVMEQERSSRRRSQPRRPQPPTPPRVASGASGGPDVGRGGRPETDAHRGIRGRSSPAQRPVSGPHPPLAAIDSRLIRRSARTRSILPHRSSRRPVAPAHAASLSRPPAERRWALLHESSLARTMPIYKILTGRCDTTLVGRGRSSD